MARISKQFDVRLFLFRLVVVVYLVYLRSPLRQVGCVDFDLRWSDRPPPKHIIDDDIDEEVIGSLFLLEVTHERDWHFRQYTRQQRGATPFYPPDSEYLD